jgi:hypothetical protein
VDQSIQPGDGGYGAILELQAFKQIFERFTLFAQGTYLFNPQSKNGTDTFRRRASEAEMSIADQYLARWGVAAAIAPEAGWSASVAGRIEGVPVRDLLGDSDGFRRPGYAISIEPGLLYTLGRHSFSFSVPIALYRNRLKSTSDSEDDTHGDAAFADFVVLFGYSLRFGPLKSLWSHESSKEKTGS